MALSFDELTQVRSLTIISLFSDDDLMESLVLKGGNALEIGYGYHSRASVDVDVSMMQEFKVMGLDSLEDIQKRLFKVLNNTFEEEGYKVFDVRIKAKPKKENENTNEFWGGYEANFKIIDAATYEKYEGNDTALAAKAFAVNEEKKNVKVDFGRFEYCESRITKPMYGYDIQIYTPQLIVFEKLRAICQQMPEYPESIGKPGESAYPRPRDFYDIHTILESKEITLTPDDLISGNNLIHLEECFKAKRVPLMLLNNIKNTKDFHEQEEPKLIASVFNKEEYEGFDYYFNYVVDLVETTIIEALHLAEKL